MTNKKIKLSAVLVAILSSGAYGQTSPEVPETIEALPEVMEERPDTTDDLIFTIAEEMPQYPGGIEARTAFIKEKVEKAKVKDGAGKVYVEFIVNKDGTLTDIKTIKGISPKADAIAERIVQSMPNWIPAKQRGKSVRLRYVLPITF